MDEKQRSKEIINIFVKLKNLNLGIMGFEEFTEFRQICNDFIRTGEFKSGEIKIPGTKRIICYKFNNYVDCMLKYDASI